MYCFLIVVAVYRNFTTVWKIYHWIPAAVECACIFEFLNVCVQMCMCVFVDVSVCVRERAHARARTPHTHTHTHTHLRASSTDRRSRHSRTLAALVLYIQRPAKKKRNQKNGGGNENDLIRRSGTTDLNLLTRDLLSTSQR
jgi:hypothetical protein